MNCKEHRIYFLLLLLLLIGHTTNTWAQASFIRVGAVAYSRLFAWGKARRKHPAYRMDMEPNAMTAVRITYGKLFTGTNGNGI